MVRKGVIYVGVVRGCIVNKYCPAGRVNCEHLEPRLKLNTKEILGWCEANKSFGQSVILDTDSQCPCPQLKRIAESKFDNFWKWFKSDGTWQIPKSFDLECVKHNLLLALKKAGYEDE